MWGKIMIPMYRLQLHGLYGLPGMHYMDLDMAFIEPMHRNKPNITFDVWERPLNLITHSLDPNSFKVW